VMNGEMGALVELIPGRESAQCLLVISEDNNRRLCILVHRINQALRVE